MIFGLGSRGSGVGSCDLTIGDPRRSTTAIDPSRLCQADLRYGPSDGLGELKQAVLETFYRDALIPRCPDNVVITNGAIHALDLILRGGLRDGDEVLIPEVAFPPYRALIGFHRAKPVTYAMRPDPATGAPGLRIGWIFAQQQRLGGDSTPSGARDRLRQWSRATPGARPPVRSGSGH